jgi:hypothetical protein
MFVVSQNSRSLSPSARREATELARRLRRHGDPVGSAVAERLERGMLLGTALIGTSKPEAIIVLDVIEQWTPERLREVAAQLRNYVGA